MLSSYQSAHRSFIPASSLLLIFGCGALVGIGQTDAGIDTLRTKSAEHERAGNFADAIRLREEILANQAKKHGDKHWRTIDARIDLDYTRILQKLSESDRAKLNQAEKDFQRAQSHLRAKSDLPARSASREAITVFEELLGKDHHRVGSANYLLGAVAHSLAKYTDAMQYLESAWKIHQQTLGEVHPQSALVLHEIGLVASRQGNLALAEEKHRRAFQIRTQTLGADHEETRRSGSKLATLLERRAKTQEANDQWTVAKKAWTEALGLLQQIKGEAHWEAFDARIALATAEKVLTLTELQRHQLKEASAEIAKMSGLHQSGDYKDALDLASKCFQTRRDLLGVLHPATQETVYWGARSLAKLNKLDAAEKALTVLLERQKKMHGEMHPKYAMYLSALAGVAYRKKEYDRSEKLVRQAMEIRKSTQGINQVDFGKTLENIIQILRARKDRPLALADAQEELARFKERQQLWIDAGAAWREAWSIRKNNSAKADVVSQTWESLQQCLERAIKEARRKNDLDANQTAYQRMLDAAIEQFGDSDWRATEIQSRAAHDRLLLKLTKEQRQSIQESDRWIDDVANLRDQYRYDDALELATKAYLLRKELLGEGDLLTLNAQTWIVRIKAIQKMDVIATAQTFQKVIERRRVVQGAKHPDIAMNLIRLADMHYNLDSFELAEPLYQEALEIRKQSLGENHPDTIRAEVYLGNTLRFLREYDKAEKLLSHAVRYQTESGELHPNHINHLLALARLSSFRKEFAKAEALWREVLELRKQSVGEQHADYLEDLAQLAGLMQQKGDDAKAEAIYQQVLKQSEETLGESHGTTVSRVLDLAYFYRITGESRKSQALYERAVRLRRESAGEWNTAYAHALERLGYFFITQGDYAKAEPLYRQALEIRRELNGEKHRYFADTLGSLAEIAVAHGDYAKAEPLRRQILKIRQEIFGPDHPLVAYALVNLAKVHQELKNYADAEARYLEALAIYRKQRLSHQIAFPCIPAGVAHFFLERHEFAKAEPLIREGLELRRKGLGENHVDFALSLSDFATLLHAQEKFGQAEVCLNQALAIRQKQLGDKHPMVARTLNHLARLYAGQGQMSKALPLILRAVQIARECLENSASIQSERQQIAFRELLSYHLDDFLRITRGDEDASTYDMVLQWKGSVTTRQRAARLARLSLTADPKARKLFEELDTLSRQIAALVLKNPKDAPEPQENSEGGDEQANQKIEIGNVNIATKVAELSARREEVEMELSARTEGFRKIRESQKLTTAGLQRLLPEKTLLVDFVVYGDRLTAFVVSGDQLRRIELDEVAPYEQAVQQFRRTLLRVNPVLGEDDVARVLRKKLVEPLAKHFSEAKLVLLAPEGPLNQLPFAALPGVGEGKYLLEEVSLATLPVPQMLPELLAKRDAAQADQQPSLLAIGDVDFESNPVVAAAKVETGWKRRRAGDLHKWPRLPGTLGEVLSIEETFRKAVPNGRLTILREGQATETSVRSNASKHEYLHFATHGFFASPEIKSVLQTRSLTKACAGESAPSALGWHPGLLSGLVFAGANKPKDDDDGVLTALEVAELDLSKVELAVLSACETGLGEVAGGEGVMGLQRAFQVAGARSAITSLWKVEDEATRKLMERFYQNYWKENMSVLEALREAQLWMLRDGVTRGIVRIENPALQTRRTPPRYWAAFMLSGDWR